MIALDKMIRIDDLRTIWRSEPQDFSKWLANNLGLLGDTINMNISLIETESPVGPYSVDIYAVEELTGRKIVIENQLESTDHDHLGKLITYAAGKGADIVIWIVQRVKGEHRQAIEWLNQHTDSSKGFFLLEIELWKIGDSKPAPRFNVVECPSGWEPSKIAIASKGGNTPLYMEFWKEFEVYAQQDKDFSNRFPSWDAKFVIGFEHQQELRVGSDFACKLIMRARARDSELLSGIFIYNNEPLFSKLKDKECEIKKLFALDSNANVEDSLQFISNPKDRFIFLIRTASVQNGKKNWHSYFEWLCDRSLKWAEFIRLYEKA
jgi:hypothetical protein